MKMIKNTVILTLLFFSLGLFVLGAENITVSNATELCAFRDAVNNGQGADTNVVLGADIDLAGITWTPVGNELYPYTGTFDGNGFSVKNLKITSVTEGLAGFFGKVTSPAVIKNVCFENAKIDIDHANTSLYAGIVAGYITADGNQNSTNLSEIFIKNGNVVVDSATLDNSSATNYVAGIVGRIEASNNARVNIKDCRINADVTVKDTASGAVYASLVAGRVGSMDLSNTTQKAAYISNCVADGDVSAVAEGKKTASAGFAAGVAFSKGQSIGTGTLAADGYMHMVIVENFLSSGSAYASSNGLNCYAGAAISMYNGEAVDENVFYTSGSTFEAIRKGVEQDLAFEATSVELTALSDSAYVSENVMLDTENIWEVKLGELPSLKRFHVEEPEFKLGDVNSDGKINNLDAVKLAQHLAGWNITLTDSEKKAADVKADEKINNLDAVKLAQYLAGWNVVLG